MRCARYRHYLDLQLDGALEKAATVRLEAHLANCDSCKSYHEQGLKLKQLVQSAPQPEVPVWIHNRIIDQCRAHESQRVQIRKRSRLQLVPAAMAVMLSLVLGSLVGKNAFSVQLQSSQTSADSGYEISLGANTLVDSDYYNGGTDE